MNNLLAGWWLRAGAIRSHWLPLVAVLGFLVSIFWVTKDATDRALLATILFSALTTIFAFLAYQFTAERFRLDLFERRYPIYEAVVKFCSGVTAHGSLTSPDRQEREAAEQAIIAAHESFRGIGYHKTRALFGEDIHELFDKLNKSYSWLAAFSSGPGRQMSQADWAQKMQDETMFIWETVNRLPQIFRSYMYFGDYKRDWV